MLKLKMFQGLLFILLVVYVGNSSCAIGSVYDAGKELWGLYSILQETYFDENPDMRDIAEVFIGTSGRNPSVRNDMNRIHEELYKLDDSVKPKIIRDSFQLSPSAIMIDKCMDTFDIFTSSIDTYYEKFRQHMNNSAQTLSPSSEDLTEMHLNVQDKIQMIRKIVIEAQELLPGHQNLIFAITGYTAAQQAEICNVSDIISRILIRIFKITIIAEIKVNIISAFANIYRYGRDEVWKFENSQERRHFRRWFGIYVNVFRENLEFTDGLYVRACDPLNGIWVRDESFYELEGTFQTTIFRHDYGECAPASCNAVLFNKTSDCGLEAYDERTSCSALVTDCFPLFGVQACVLKEGPYKFQYVDTEGTGRNMGSDFKCPKNSGYIITDRVVSGSNHTACACNCYGNHNKISLSLMESRTNLNMVITGVRFSRKNNILYIQPREGKLDSEGRIVRSSSRWVPIPKNSRKSQIQAIDQDNKVFFLDDLRLPPKYILTGIKWNKVTRGPVEGFAIEIFGVPFDYESGKLLLPRSDPGEDTSFELTSPYAMQWSETDKSAQGGYVSLGQSTLLGDFGQKTIPFFDAVPITPGPSLLGGIGIFYKDFEGYTGFFSMRVYGIEYGQYFKDFIYVNMKNGKVILDHSLNITSPLN